MSSLASAKLIVNIDVKPSFKEGERLYFNYSIYSDEDAELTYVSHIVCPDNVVSFLKEESITIKAGETYNGVYTDFVVSEMTERATCTASIAIGKSGDVGEIKAAKTFLIDVPPSMKPRILTCKDTECMHPSKIFIKGEKIFLKIETNDKDGKKLSDVVSSGSYGIGEAKETLNIVNERAKLTADKTGNYVIESTSVKPGYKTAKAKTEFAVINTHANIADKRICIPDSVCSSAETPKNCPQDCLKFKKSPRLNIFHYIISKIKLLLS